MGFVLILVGFICLVVGLSLPNSGFPKMAVQLPIIFIFGLLFGMGTALLFRRSR